MKILLCHNYYQQPGGEDQVFADDMGLLACHGHEVVPYTVRNDAIRHMPAWKIAHKTLWNRETCREVRALIRRERPDVMHCHNTFPLISPSLYYAARRERVPVVQTLHNYRLLCPSGLLLRKGRICEDCLRRPLAWPALVHGCYRGSRVASAVVAAMLATHRASGTWSRAVTRYIALTQFARQKFIAGGLPAGRIAVKPNCVVPDPGPGSGQGGYAVFVGRLSQEKGVATLLTAWRQLAGQVPLRIVGDGPLREPVRAAADGLPGVQWLGWRPFEEVLAVIGDAALLVMPSIWYEPFGRTVIEAYAKGTPVLAARVGGMVELVDHGRTGLLFAPGSSEDLAATVRQFWADLPAAPMRQAAREQYEANYTAEANYRMLMNIYVEALCAAGARIPAEDLRRAVPNPPGRTVPVGGPSR
jgi:glycosyltransferase involved in cell wall biosynthesis